MNSAMVRAKGIDGPLYADRLGRLTTKDGEGHKAIAVTDEGTLKIEDHR